MATRKPRSSKPATKKPTTKATSATDEAVDGPDATEAAPTPADVPEAVSVDDAPNGGEVQVEDQQDGGSPGEAIEAEAEQPAPDATPEQSEQDSTELPVEDSLDQPVADVTSKQSEQNEAEGKQPAAFSDAITRKYKGRDYRLERLGDGTFRLDGVASYASLTAAAQAVLNVTGGVSGPRWWLGASTTGGGTGGSRLTSEERAVRAAQKAADKARKAEAKAAALRAAEAAALDEVIGLIAKAAQDGRLRDDQVERLRTTTSPRDSRSMLLR